MRRFLVLLSLAATAPLAAAAAQPVVVDTLTIRYVDTAAQAGSTLSAQRRQSLAAALGSAVADFGITRDGAYVLHLASPRSVEEARAALASIRGRPEVLYAKASSALDTARAQALQPKADDASPTVPRLIVKFRDTVGISAEMGRSDNRVELVAGAAGQPVAFERTLGGGETLLALMTKMTRGQAERVARALESNPAVEYADPDLLMRPLLTPSDPLYGNQWDLYDPLSGIDAPTAWNITTGAAGVYIGVIDTGIRPHEDLNGRFVGGFDFIASATVAADGDGRDADPTDPGDWVSAGQCEPGSLPENNSWHGMHVAGTIAAAANNGVGIAGINWVGRVVPMRVLGKCGGFTSDIADAIRWGAGLPVSGVPANAFPVRVENLSLGGTGSCGTTLQNAINGALGNNTVIVVASGNDNRDAASDSPGNCNGVITVAATVRDGSKASYSNYGSTIEIAAPGGGDGNFILSTVNNGSQVVSGDTYANYQGTSMAAPHVSGIASLVLSVNPALTPAQVLGILQSTARVFRSGTGRDCTTSICGAGIVNAGSAVAAAAGQTAHDYEGFDDVADCQAIAGWAWDRFQPNTPLSVDVYSDGVLVTTVSASQFRGDLAAAGKGNGSHGFALATPGVVQDGQPHSVSVRFGGTAINLSSSPRTLTCGQATTPRYEGFHDVADCTVLAGWAWNQNLPNTPISVDIYSDGGFVARTAADLARGDLAAAGKGNGVHGFMIATPPALKNGQPHAISVAFGGTSTPLSATPRSIACSAPAAPRYEGFHDGADCQSINGWAWDQNQPNSSIDVDLYVDGTYTATIFANGFRGDLAAAGKGNGAHAFNVPTPAALKDSLVHTIDVRYGGTTTDLFSSPKAVSCAP